jgi:SAM-dependent methyltransferase
VPPDAAVVAFVRAALPPRPARVLEVGAGRGELAAAVRDAGYDVVAIDPAADGAAGVEPVALADLEAADGAFDAAVAVVSLHHVEPLMTSCERLAEVVRAGGRLVIDEFDVDRFDDRAARWLAAQRSAAGLHMHGEPADWPTDLREHLHPLADVRSALAPAFAFGEPVRGAYLYRWDLDPALRTIEERLVAEGALPATGARLVAIRR